MLEGAVLVEDLLDHVTGGNVHGEGGRGLVVGRDHPDGGGSCGKREKYSALDNLIEIDCMVQYSTVK